MLSRKTIASAAVGTLVAAVSVTVLPEAFSTTSAEPVSHTFTPTADTFIRKSAQHTNYGTVDQVSADNNSVKRAFMKFEVSGFEAPVTSAKLRVHVADVEDAESPAGGTFRLMSDTTWSETAVTWGTRPFYGGQELGSLGAVSRDTWYEIDVTSHVTRTGTFGISITSADDDGADYDSRESGITAPQLVVTTEADPGADPGGDPGADPGADPGRDPEADPGSDPGAEPGRDPEADPGSDPGADPGEDPVLVGVGDIAGNWDDDEATAKLLDDIPGTVFTTGDNAYQSGSASEYNKYYAPTWGRHKDRTRPVPGNHEYRTPRAQGYYDYFGAAAGDPDKGYYSYDLGKWHVVALNSSVSMSKDSPQERWLREDLKATSKQCTIAYLHHPRFTSSEHHRPNPAVGPLVQALYDNGAEILVAGHNHQYERFAPMDPDGELDTDRGIRHFVAGMGGAGASYAFGTILPNSEARNSDTSGVLKFTLHDDSYDWEFVPVAGKTYADAGTTDCH
ncbi:DNRLRE domain-containing protein [Streptomyces sp. M41]|uniref:CBM96 family carbohydrate-binding protein n=1 Tax=Streptomyces sp. M41 TaxID=3059412 RepID=UPI00374D6752